MTNDDDTQWLPVEDAAALLGISERSTQRYGAGSSPRLRTRRRVGTKRLYYFRPDVETLADDLGVARRPPAAPAPPKPELVPAGELLAYLRQRDAQLEAKERELRAAAAELGALRTELGQQRLLADKGQALADRLQEVETERNQLQTQIAELHTHERRLVILAIVLYAALVIALVIWLIWR